MSSLTLIERFGADSDTFYKYLNLSDVLYEFIRERLEIDDIIDKYGDGIEIEPPEPFIYKINNKRLNTEFTPLRDNFTSLIAETEPWDVIGNAELYCHADYSNKFANNRHIIKYGPFTFDTIAHQVRILRQGHFDGIHIRPAPHNSVEVHVKFIVD